MQLRSLLGGYLDYDNLIRVNEILYSVQHDALNDRRISGLGLVISPLAGEACDLELEASRFYFPTRQNLSNYMTAFLFILYRLNAIAIPKVCGVWTDNVDLAALLLLRSFDESAAVHSPESISSKPSRVGN